MVVDSQSWEEVQGKALQMVHNGELTEGVVKAGHAVLEEARNRNEDPRIISSLEDAVGLLSSAFQMQMTAPPGLRVADECANMMIAAGSPDAAKVRGKTPALRHNACLERFSLLLNLPIWHFPAGH